MDGSPYHGNDHKYISIINSCQKNVEVFCVALVNYKVTIIIYYYQIAKFEDERVKI